jgi:uridylate kinase
VDLLEEKVVVIFVGGTGFPYLTTDTAAALRACEIQAEALIKATKVDGVFDQDPKKNGKAQLMTQMTYNEVLRQNLHVMDAAAVALCRDQNIPIHVINIFKKGALQNVIEGRKEGSVVRG